jgi:hypothetical protein
MSLFEVKNIVDVYPQYPNANGLPLSGGRLVFRDASTNSLKEIYTDAGLTTPANNPQVLGIDGRTEQGPLWFGVGVYKVTLQASDGAGGWIDVWTNPSVQGSIEAGADVVNFEMVANIAELKSAVAGFSAYVLVANYYTNDRGGGLFKWNASSSASDDGGAVIAPNSMPATGRWERIFWNAGVIADQFGAVAGASPVEGFLLQANTYCNATGKSLTIGSGTYTLSANCNLNGAYPLIIDGAEFTSSTGATLTLATSGLTITQIEPLRLATLNLVITSYLEWVSPIWWGAVGNGSSDDYSGFVRMTGRHSAPVLIDRTFLLSAIGSPSIELISLYGLLIREGGSITCTYTDADKVVIGSIQMASRANYAIVATDLGVFSFTDRILSARLFFSYNATEQKVIIDTTTLTALRDAQGEKTFSFDGDFDYLHQATTTGFVSDCLIQNGTLIYTDGVRRLGYVQASPTQICFAQISEGNSILLENKIIYGSWYGVRSGDETANFLFVLASLGTRVVDFNNASFAYNGTGSVTINTFNARNAEITFSGTTPLLGNCDVRDVTFSGNFFSVNTTTIQKFTNCRFLSAYTPVSAQGSHSFIRCTFDVDVIYTNLSVNINMLFDGCTFNGMVQYSIGAVLPDYSAKFVGCSFLGNYSTIPNLFSNSKLVGCDFKPIGGRIDFGQYVSVTSCEFRDQNSRIMLVQSATSLSEMEVTISNCVFGKIAIDGTNISNANTIVTSIIMTDNIVNPSSTYTTPFNGIVLSNATNIASSGHYCHISNNMPILTTIGDQGSTYGSLTLTFDSSVVSNFNTDQVILPRNPKTTSGAANPACDVDTFRLVTT